MKSTFVDCPKCNGEGHQPNGRACRDCNGLCQVDGNAMSYHDKRRVFLVDDSESNWVVAATPEEALKAISDSYGFNYPSDWDGCPDFPAVVELSPYSRLTVVYEDSDGPTVKTAMEWAMCETGHLCSTCW